MGANNLRQTTMNIEQQKSKAEVVLTELLRALSSHKELNKTPKVEEHRLTRASTLSIKSSHEDYGRIIGAGSKNYKSLELIVKLVAAREDEEVQLSVVPPKNHMPSRENVFRANPKWGKQQLLPLLRCVCDGLFESGTINIQDVDPATVTCEIKVNSDSEFYVIDSGDRVYEFADKNPTTKEEISVPITLKLIEKKLGNILYSIGKANGRTCSLYIIGVNFPKAVGV